MIRFTTRGILRSLIGITVGILVGVSVGIHFVRFAGPILYGRDYQQFSFVLGLLAFNVGALLGAVLGGLTINYRPYLFMATFGSLGILVMGEQITLRVLRSIDRPRTFDVKLSGSTGAQFAGNVIADGRLHKHAGTLPAEFKYRSLEVDLAFALVNRSSGDKIAAEVFVDGRHTERRFEHDHGTRWHFYSHGYAEWVGGTAYEGGGEMSEENAEQLVKHHTMPPPGIEVFNEIYGRKFPASNEIQAPE